MIVVSKDTNEVQFRVENMVHVL